jgi:hypothetical protein
LTPERPNSIISDSATTVTAALLLELAADLRCLVELERVAEIKGDRALLKSNPCTRAGTRTLAAIIVKLLLQACLVSYVQELQQICNADKICGWCGWWVWQ